MLVVFFLLDHVHGVRISQVIDVEELLCFPLHVEGIEPISLQAFSFIDDLSSIPIENCPFPIFESESLVEPLSQPISVHCIKFSCDLKVVVTVDKLSLICREESSIVEFSNYFEVKWVLSILKPECREVHWKTKIFQWVSRESSTLRHFVSLFFVVSDSYIEIIESQRVELELEFLNNGTCLFLVEFFSAEVGQGQEHGVKILGSMRYSILGSRVHHRDQSKDT